MNADDIDRSYGSLFAGGGGLDLGLEAAGFQPAFFVENDADCLALLGRAWPDVPANVVRSCGGLVGGDPCPVRSCARYMRGTIKPDLSGYFLAMVARLEPRWVLRENVRAPDVGDFAAGLELLGYRAVVIESDSAAFTGQSRKREWVVGFLEPDALDRFVGACDLAEELPGPVSADIESAGEPRWRSAVTCLTSRRLRCVAHDTYVYEDGRGLRVLAHEEREALQGWPRGWTAGLSSMARERISGNGVTAPVAEWIGRRIMSALYPQTADRPEGDPQGGAQTQGPKTKD